MKHLNLQNTESLAAGWSLVIGFMINFSELCFGNVKLFH